MTKVKLVAKTQGVNDLVNKKAQDIVSYCARVSSPKNQENFNTAPKLLKYCIKHKHWSVFEMANFVFEVKTTVAIAAQLLRHKSMSFQQFSARYSNVEDYHEIEARSQDLKNRQNSVDDVSEEDKEWFRNAQAEVWDKAYGLYQEGLSKGIAKEQMRFLLPQNTETTLYVNGTLRSLIHYIDVRDKKGSAQKEHGDIAEKMKEILKVECPDVAEALEW